MNILYLRIDSLGAAPGGRPRFLGVAALLQNVKIYFSEESGINFAVVAFTLGGDLAKAFRLSAGGSKLKLGSSDNYVVENSFFKSRLSCWKA